MANELSNITVEEKLLRTCMSDADLLYEVIDNVGSDDFTLDSHKSLFGHITTLLKNGSTVDEVTVGNKLTMFDNKPLYDKITSLSPLTTYEINDYVKILRDCTKARAVVKAGKTLNDLIAEAKLSPDEILTRAEEIIYNASSGSSGDTFSTPATLMRDAIEAIKTKKASDGQLLLGLTTGIDSLDRMIYGLEKSDMTIIAGRPGMGKTQLALQLLWINALAGIPSAFFSLEMSNEQLINRLITLHLQIQHHKIKKGFLNKDELTLIEREFENMSKAPLFIEDDASLVVTDIIAKVRKLKNKHPELRMVVVDYIQLMLRSHDANRELTEISRMFKILAKQLDITVIPLSQLSRDCEKRDNKRPMLADLRESGSLEQDADKVIFVYNHHYYSKMDEDKYKSELIVAKHRGGNTGTVHVTNNQPLQRFFDESKLLNNKVDLYNESIVKTQLKKSDEKKEVTEKDDFEF